ncbi:MAG: MFS transporter [bacterium]|nr:MFS transporter [bacterium]
MNKNKTGLYSPLTMLILLTIAMQLSHQTWHTLVNNFTVSEIGFTGREIGIVGSVREIPGFLAFGAILLVLFLREQYLAYVSLLVLAAGTAMTGLLPNEYGFYITTLIMSLGFHYFETMNQSLSLQWLPKNEAAYGLGKIVAAGSFASLIAYVLIYLTWSLLGLPYWQIYLIAAALTAALLAFVMIKYPLFPQHVEQHKKLLMRQRYWLFYALTFMGGARRQIFIVFAGFMIVEKFGYSVGAITTLFLINHLFNMFFAPKIGKLIRHVGERSALTLEYIGLIIIFSTYAFVENATLAAVLYVADHGFFAMAVAIKTYFQKIADPKDIAPTAGVAFSINHIAAVSLPVMLGYVWLQNPSAVFLIGAGFAFISLLLARLVPRHPEPGFEHVGLAPKAKTVE